MKKGRSGGVKGTPTTNIVIQGKKSFKIKDKLWKKNPTPTSDIVENCIYVVLLGSQKHGIRIPKAWDLMQHFWAPVATLFGSLWPLQNPVI